MIWLIVPLIEGRRPELRVNNNSPSTNSTSEKSLQVIRNRPTVKAQNMYLQWLNDIYERATFACATGVVIHSYLYSGLRPSIRGKITYDNENLRNLRQTKNICHIILALIISKSAYQFDGEFLVTQGLNLYGKFLLFCSARQTTKRCSLLA